MGLALRPKLQMLGGRSGRFQPIAALVPASLDAGREVGVQPRKTKGSDDVGDDE